jgi:hypothetical protein
MVEETQADAARATPAWAWLIHKVYAVDRFECPRCKVRMRVIAPIENPEAMRNIIGHLTALGFSILQEALQKLPSNNSMRKAPQ